MKKLCVFCGSGTGNKPEYTSAAEELGKVLIKRNIGLVYGGGRVGLMGKIASVVHNEKGEVTGVIPRKLFEMEVAFAALSDLRVVETMHERKALMAELSDGFIALPGGLGTIEEFFEVVTWAQLNFHSKPCGLLNVSGYFDHLIKFLDHCVEEGFIQPENRSIILIDDNPESLVDKLLNYKPVKFDKAGWALNKQNNKNLT